MKDKIWHILKDADVHPVKLRPAANQILSLISATTIVKKPPEPCKCLIKTLMSSGCKCGGV